MRSLACGLIAIALLILLAVPARLEGQATTTATTMQAGDPKAVAAAFVQAMASGDAAGAQQLAVFSDDPAMRQREQEMLGATTAMMDAFRRMSEAAVAKFGDAAEGLQAASPAAQAMKDIDSGEVKIEGNSATVGGGPKSRPLRLRQVDGVWKVDLSNVAAREQDLDRVAGLLQAMAQAADETTKEIDADRFRNVDEIRHAMDLRLRDRLLRAASRPTTVPTAPAAK